MKSGSAHVIAAFLLAYSIAAAGAAMQPSAREDAVLDGAPPPTQQVDIAPLVSLLQSPPVRPAVPKSDELLAPRVQPRESAKLTAKLGAMPLSFEANRGQTAEEVEFIARGPSYTIFLTPTEAVFALRQASASQERSQPGRRGVDALPRAANPGAVPDVPEEHEDDSAPKGAVIRMKLQGAGARPAAHGLEALPGKVNYFRGNDPAKWHTGIPTYRKVQYKDVYPGIDLVYYGNPRQLEHDFVVAPGADPDRIRIAFEGLEGKTDAPKLRIADDGNLVLSAQGGDLLVKKPHVYQEVDGRRVDVAADFVVHQPELGKAVGLAGADPASVGFRLAAYDRGRPVVIDPVVLYSTYLGGSAGGISGDNGNSIALDANGNAYVTGTTFSDDFPTVHPKYRNLWGVSDVFVVKLSSNGETVLYSTYIGGSDSESDGDIAVDPNGNAYLTGVTFSNDFPMVHPKYRNLWGISDAFVIKLSSNGQTVRYSTYLGGSGFELATGIAVDTKGNAYVTGRTDSTDFPTVHPKYPNLWGGVDAFVFKLSSDGQTVRYSTYLGGSGYDMAFAIATDAMGNAYVTGVTHSVDFPTVHPKYRNLRGAFDAFVFKLSSDGQTVRYSTYLGGSDEDSGYGIAVDMGGNAYVTGRTESNDFPTVHAIHSSPSGCCNGFVFKLSSDGETVHYSTYLGGRLVEGVGYGIAVDVSGNAYITGGGRLNEAFVVKLSSNGETVLYSTVLDGSIWETGYGIAVDTSGNAYVTGTTSSNDFPTVHPKYPNLWGLTDAFIAKISDTGGGVFADPNQTAGLPGVINDPTEKALLPPDPSCVNAGDPRKCNVVVLVHGWNSNPVAWANNTKGIIEGRLRAQGKLCGPSTVDSCWVVAIWNWDSGADTLLPLGAWNAGYFQGPALAQWLRDTHGTRLNHVHLVGHSAGSNVIQQAAYWFEENKRKGGIAPQSLHLTFLDPYTPDASAGVQTYGKVDGIPSFSDSYLTDELPEAELADFADFAALPVSAPVAWITYFDTKPMLVNAYNFRVGGLDTDEAASSAIDWTVQNHAWPYQFYQCSANPGVPSFSGETGEPCPAGYNGTYAFGFPLSQEFAQSASVVSLYALRRTYRPGHSCFAESITDCPDAGATANLVVTEGVQNFVDTTAAVASFTGQATVQFANQVYEVGSATFQLIPNLSLSLIDKLGLSTGSPIWVRLPVTITEPANSLRFDFNFTQGTRGYLQAFIHDKQIYSADQRFYGANTAWHSPEIALGELEPGTYEIAFRLDSFTDAQSVAELTNITLGILRAVVAPNQAPIANAGANRTVRLGSLVTLDGSASVDPDDGPMALTYNWLQSGGSAASLSDPANVQPTFTPASAGSYAFSLTVGDGEASSPAATVVITVPALGDIDGDGDVDNNDLNLVLAARNQPASGANDLRDLDGNSKIDALDARKLTTLCTRPRCAVQ